jgi:hypothetical protein
VAKRVQESALKRAKEKARMEKQAAKRERRATRSESDETGTETDERKLWEEYARLSERHASNTVSLDHYDKERNRILTELGIEPDQ